MRVALVPMGYGDGIPRHASNTAEVLVDGVRGARARTDLHGPVRRRGARRRTPGTRWCCSARGLTGEPTATDWARWCGTIDYEIVTRMGGRQTRDLGRGRGQA